MYTPKHFEEPETHVMHRLMRERPLATLVTIGSDGPDANAIPMQLIVREDTPLGVLRGHVARANPLWREHPAETPTLAIFHGAESYISPAFYATKAESGKVVPTWNYVLVQARGHLRVIHDPQWIHAQIDALTHARESASPQPWAVTDAPPDYIEKLIGAIVGIEITINRLQGKWKVSQNQPPSNREGVINGLNERAMGEDTVMASLVHQRGETRPA